MSQPGTSYQHENVNRQFASVVGSLIAADSALVDVNRTTPLASQTIGRKNTESQLNAAKRIAGWICSQGSKCVPPLDKKVITAASIFLNRWPVGFRTGRPSSYTDPSIKGSAKCWICGEPITEKQDSDIEHILGMRLSAYGFTALCTAETLSFGNLEKGSWHTLTHSTKINEGELNPILCNVNWENIYDFLYNYAPAHNCCNLAKSQVNEQPMSYMIYPVLIPGQFQSKFLINNEAIKQLLDNIKDNKTCRETIGLWTRGDRNWDKWRSKRMKKIEEDYLRPYINARAHVDKAHGVPSELTLLSQISTALDARDSNFKEKVNKYFIEYTKNFSKDSNMSGLPYYRNMTNRYEPTFELLAHNMNISPDELKEHLDDDGSDGGGEAMAEEGELATLVRQKRRNNHQRAMSELIEMMKQRKLYESPGERSRAIRKKSENRTHPYKKKGGKKRYTKKKQFRSNLRKNTRKFKKKSTKKSINIKNLLKKLKLKDN